MTPDRTSRPSNRWTSSPVSAIVSTRNDVLRDVERLAARQGGVVSRRQLLACGVPRWRTRSQVRAKRWRVHGRQTVAVHTGDLGQLALLWAGTFEAGTRGVLDGTAALLAAGLQGYAVDRIRVSVPRGAKAHRSLLFDIRPEVAAVRAALWAATDRQAALIVSMVVQQRIAAADAIGRELLAVRRDRRRRFVERVVLDVMGGSESLGELDLMRECRRRDIPLPDRQVVRGGARGTFFLDARWARFGVVLEIDGIHHVHATQVVGDALRQNDVVLDGDLVLRLPLLGLRVSPDAFFAQLTQALRTRGWQGRHSA
jgi:very-short-patch-repair endonuclease